MVKPLEARIEEYPSPTDYPWDMYLKRKPGDKNVEVTVCGSKGGLKARFFIRYVDLETAVYALNP